ncbi:MAG: VWA domain-containing protein [Thermoanaerobaculia bacterium]|nr:VWA domain-containing protein [Thermoanaerobaculia bacterium]
MSPRAIRLGGPAVGPPAREPILATPYTAAMIHPRVKAIGTRAIFVLWFLLSSGDIRAASPGVSDYEADVALWIAAIGTPDEVRVYRALRDTVHRERFLLEFWRARGLGTGIEGSISPTESRSEDAWQWARRSHLQFLDARERFEELSSAEARTYLQAGPPAREVVFGGCRGIVRPLRMWWYDEHQAADLMAWSRANEGPDSSPTPPEGGFWRVFVRDYSHPGDFRDWWPGEGIEALSEDDAPFPRSTLGQILSLSREGDCFRKGELEADVVEQALQTAWSPERLTRLLRARTPDPSWLDTFAESVLTSAGEGAADDVVFAEGTSLELRAAGSDSRETFVRGRVSVPGDVLRRNGSGRVFDRLTVRGEALVGASVVDDFAHIFHVIGRPGDGAGTAEVVELDVWRRLRPRDYTFRLRVEDAAGRALLVAKRWVRVPLLAAPTPATAARHHMGLAGLTRDRVSTLVTFPEIRIVSPGVAQAGPVDLEVRATGGRIERIDVWLDGRFAASDDAPPWRFPLDLGDEPAPHAVQAVAFDADGRELSRDALRLDPGPRPFQVELEVDEDRGITRAEVSLPRDSEATATPNVTRVEISTESRLLGAFPEPPYRQSFSRQETEGAAFLRAVATLDDGRQAEDFFFLRGQGVESVDVRLVEIWATVLDSRDRPVTRLDADDFRVLDEGELQPLLRVDMVTDLPIRVALVMDTSTSMRTRLPTAVASARRFFETVVTPDDAAALLTFDHRLRLRTPFTAEPSRLGLGAAGLEAAGGTRLHDALVWTLGYLGGGALESKDGPEGLRDTERRALVLLSDGRDVGSDFPFREALQHAVESGVAVYPILLAVGDSGTRSDLVRIANESGGAAFEIDDVEDLDWVYSRIEEELRSQYLLVYASPGTRRGAFRHVEVQLERPGIRARAVRGYYR